MTEGAAHATILAGLILVVSAFMAPPVQAFDGEWRTTSITRSLLSAPPCSRLEVTLKDIDLQTRPDGQLEGGMIVQFQPVWIGGGLNCPSGERPSDWRRSYRSESWYVISTTVSEERAELHLEFDQCLGACEDLPASRAPSSMTLFKTGSALSMTDADGQWQRLRLKSEVVTLEAEAAAMLLPLMQPLLDRNCPAFYRDMVHSAVVGRTTYDDYCRDRDRIASLIPQVLYDQLVTGLWFDFGTLTLGPDVDILLKAGGDNVLVERALVVDSVGSNMLVAAVLRKDGAGAWRFVALVP